MVKKTGWPRRMDGWIGACIDKQADEKPLEGCRLLVYFKTGIESECGHVEMIFKRCKKEWKNEEGGKVGGRGEEYWMIASRRVGRQIKG